MAGSSPVVTMPPSAFNNEQPVVSTLPPSAFQPPTGAMPPSTLGPSNYNIGTVGMPNYNIGTMPPSAYTGTQSMPYSGMGTLPPQSFGPGSKGMGKGDPYSQMDMSIPGAAVATLPPSAFAPAPTLPPSLPGAGYPSMGMPGKGMAPPFSKGMGKGYPTMGAATMGPPETMAPPATMGPSEERDIVPDAGDADAGSQIDLDKNQEDHKKWHNIRQFTAYMFTLTAFTVLAAPTIISIQLGLDVDASFWIGKWGLVALFVPVFLLGQHFYHIWMLNNRRERRRYIFFLVPVLPAVLFMIIGGTYMSFARNLYGQLKSDDCSLTGPTPSKYWMQDAYDEARASYDQCITRLRNDNLGAPLRRHPNLQSCLEWDDLIQHEDKRLTPWKGYKVQPGTLRQFNPSNLHRWQYLANIEINHVCGGFCKAGPSLFVSYDLSGRQGGSCSQFVAFRFLSIHHWGTVVFTIGLLIVLISIPTYVMSRGFLNTMGYKSASVIA